MTQLYNLRITVSYKTEEIFLIIRKSDGLNIKNECFIKFYILGKNCLQFLKNGQSFALIRWVIY